MSKTRALLVLPLLFAVSCLKSEQVDNVQRSEQCVCSPLKCTDGKISRQTPKDEEDPCAGCNQTPVAACAQGCGTATRPVDGCPIGYVCKTWDRVAEGTACTSDLDCTPGPDFTKRMTCITGKCVLTAANATVPKARECAGTPAYGPHAECGGAACVSVTTNGQRYCSAGRCIFDEDCPDRWRCRCSEESSPDGVISHRWCVPDLDAQRSDAGFPSDDIVPFGADAGM